MKEHGEEMQRRNRLPNKQRYRILTLLYIGRSGLC
jgi:hypothetical protein